MVADLMHESGPRPPFDEVPLGVASLADYEHLARAHMSAEAWHHVQQGAGPERTLAENRAAFARWGFLPRAMADLRDGSTRVSILGREHAAPLMLAPVAYQRLVHPEGEGASVRAAVALGVGVVVSTLASVTLEEVARAAQAAAAELGKAMPPLWFQLYLQPDRAHSLELVRRAEAAGYEAIVLTVDAAVKPVGMTLPDGVGPANLAGFPRLRQVSRPGGEHILFGTPLLDAAPRWDDMRWLRAATALPIVVKGMVLGEDAARLRQEGADGLILSNHGGRTLDGLPSALDVLAGVLDAVGDLPVLLDGGIRSGTDIVKALAQGARAALVGRPVLHALAVAGLPGVAHALHLLRTELEATMALLGCREVAELTAARLIRLPGAAA